MTTPNSPVDPAALDMAVRLVLAMLPQQEIVQGLEVAAACARVDAMLAGMPGGSPGLENISRAVESRVVIWQEASKSLVENKGHVEWLPEAKATRQWEFWDRYRRYLTDVEGLPRQVVWRTGETTDDIIRKLEDPQRAGPWDRRGLVVGDVQSGKTANYLGVICKAADAGYRLIVVLTGMHNSLRSQTQLRIDEGLLGFDTQYQQRYDEEKQGSSRIGVGAMPGAPRLKIGSLTTSAEKGDFKKGVYNNSNVPISDYPFVLVIKKHRSIIDNVRKWVTEVEGVQKAGTDEKIVPAGISLLVVDDEADQASVNTKAVDDPEADPTKVNAAIRELLESFEQRAYVGYTATPYANIYADPGAGHKKYGRDIFPSSFIESLRPPSNYFGPVRVFGLRSKDPLEPELEPLPIFRDIKDQKAWLADGHKPGTTPGDLPGSLLKALNSFVLVCAARRARGQATKHNSMLVHATAWVDVQQRVAGQISDEIQFLRDRVHTDGARPDAPVWQELRALWDEDFVETSGHFPVKQPLIWEDVRSEVGPALEKITIRTINGSSKDALDYYENRRTGLSVIAIGGNKLSRGLTLEGLSVSYYLRASKMYDTLLQMGRWFGYRPDYEDLCRLFTTDALRRAYREITAANEELRADLEEMAVQGQTPEQYGLRVRSSVNGLLVTAPSKSRRAQKIKLSFSGDVNETSIFDVSPAALEKNWDTLHSFVRQLDKAAVPLVRRPSGSVLWTGVPPELVAEQFLRPYVADRMAQRVRPEFIAQYVQQCALAGELSAWSVMLVGVSGGPIETIAGYDVGLVERAPLKPLQPGDERYTIRRVLNPADESVDLEKGQADRGLEKLKEGLHDRYEAEGKLEKLDKLKVPSGPFLRRQRRPDQALLLIYPLQKPHDDLACNVVGFAVSFPFSQQTIELKGEYVVNQVWLQAGFDEGDLPE